MVSALPNYIRSLLRKINFEIFQFRCKLKCKYEIGFHISIDCLYCLSREIHRHRHEKKFPQGRETLQRDAYIGPKPGLDQTRLFPEYGTNFRYIGEVKHGLDRVTVVTSIPISKYSDIRKKPLHFNCKHW